jgi:hypothetical protein
MENNKDTKTAKVEIFGEDVTDGKNKNNEDRGRHHHFHFEHRHHGSFSWGLFFVVIGVLILLSNLGALPQLTWGHIVRFWPVLFIFIGLDILTFHSWVSDIISSLLGLFIFATILGIVFLNVAPQILNGFPPVVMNYLAFLNSYLQLK